ncbi:glycosyltransferase family 4 protein [Cohnella fermenti]|uniref:Glycosyltransferase family 1 protein n=1 Tax=Cohnella fermenti TaxID=2565925 RepID=A0A4S4BL76_9BACL|nr:glycosyltransferase family 1 protein [Cohnella fermenti]THF73032.1 glycosyltransferase family 1 protein [Cohnella fermenti]
MEELRIALFTDTYSPEVNGVAKTLERWTAYLRRQGIAVQVFAPSRPRGESAPQGAAERLASVPFFLYPELRLSVPVSPAAERKLLDFRPTLIHVATPFGTGMTGRRLALKHDIPLIASHHTHFVRYLPYYNLQWMGRLLWRYLYWFHRPCDRILVPSPSVLEECSKKGWSGLDVWSRAIDTSVFHPGADRAAVLERAGIPADRFVALSAGRLAPEKQTEVAVEAVARFAERAGVEPWLVLAGEGPADAELRALAAKLGVRAVFLGSVAQAELQSWMASADAMLFPSPTETFGNVVLEAMACGLPVIGANAGAVPDTLKHRVSGLLCAPGQPDEFADALAELHGDKALRERLSHEALRTARSKSWDEVFGGLLACAVEVSSGKSRERDVISV